MSSSIEKVTLSLDRKLLEKMASRARKNMSQYVRDLLELEAKRSNCELVISKEILEMKGLLKNSNKNSKERVREKTIEKIRDYER